MISLTEKSSSITFNIEPERITSVKNVKYSSDEEWAEITVDYVRKIAVKETFFDVINLMAKALMTEKERE